MARKKKSPWERRKFFNRRKSETRNQIDTILIVCEGEKTEPNYFKKFPVNKEVVEIDILGEGKNTLSLVKKAISIRDEKKERYNQVWVVFDKDDFDDDQFDNAIIQAKNNKIFVAYSNEAFELWYLLHFIFNDSALDRDQYIIKLNHHLGIKYKKNSQEMFDLLKENQEKAIKNAKKLYNLNISPPSKANPSTTVFKLVEILNEFC